MKEQSLAEAAQGVLRSQESKFSWRESSWNIGAWPEIALYFTPNTQNTSLWKHLMLNHPNEENLSLIQESQ